jgi:hypothetical protein
MQPPLRTGDQQHAQRALFRTVNDAFAAIL